jgi:hypothetical protein
MGLSLKPIVGMSDGYYSLDLSQEKNRACFTSLLEQSEYRKVLRIRDSYESKVRPRPSVDLTLSLSLSLRVRSAM